MKIKFDITKILKSKLLLICTGAITLIGILFLLVFSGKTAPQYTLSNLKFSLLIKAFMTAVFILGFTVLYFLIRFRKDGVWLGLFTALSAVINAVVSFALCIITRAPLGDLTFAVVMFSVLLTYLTAILFKNNLEPKAKKKKKIQSTENSYMISAKKTVDSLKLFLTMITLILIATFVISLIYGANILAFYALPTILTAVFSVVFTLGFGCKLFYNKTN